MRCDEVAGRLPSIMAGAVAADPSVVDHVEACLACHAELARYRKTLRMLGQLRFQPVDPPPGLLADVLEALDAAARRRVVRSLLTGRRVAYGSAIAGAAAVAVLVVAARVRSTRPAVLHRGARSEQGAML